MTASISRGHLKLGNLLVKLRSKRKKDNKFNACCLIGLKLELLEFLGLNRDNFSQKWRVGVFFGTLEKFNFSNKLLEKAVWVNFTLDRICRLLLKI